MPIMALSLSAMSQSTYYLAGTGGANWSVSATWLSNLAPPTNGNNVITADRLENSGTTNTTVDIDARVGNISLNANTTITINSGVTLTIVDLGLTNNIECDGTLTFIVNGTLTVEDGNFNASAIIFSGSGTVNISGNITGDDYVDRKSVV